MKKFIITSWLQIYYTFDLRNLSKERLNSLQLQSFRCTNKAKSVKIFFKDNG